MPTPRTPALPGRPAQEHPPSAARYPRGASPLRLCLSRAAALLLCGSATGAAVAAGPAPAAQRPPPWQADAAVPAHRHVSAFAGYRRHDEVAAGDWRAANEAVNRIGGWRAYGREAGAPLRPLPPLDPAGVAASPPHGAPQPTSARDAAAPAEPAAPGPRGSGGGHGGHQPAPAAGGSR